MVTKKDFKLIKELSEKGFNFSNTQSRKQSKRITSVRDGIVASTSGYLAVCEAGFTNAYSNLPLTVNFPYRINNRGLISLNHPPWGIPNLMQGDNFVAFRSFYGDGGHTVFSSKKNTFYVDNDMEFSYNDQHGCSYNQDLIDRIKSGEGVKERIGHVNVKLEGFVSVDSGAMIVIDPTEHSFSPLFGDYGISTVLVTSPGVYVCRFIYNGKKLTIHKRH